MKQSIIQVALVVQDYDEAIDFYVNTLGFDLVEDTYQPEQDKRWVVVAPPGGTRTTLLLARASNDVQSRFVGNQCGGRVFLFLNTDDFWRDYERMKSRGVQFVRDPKEQPYGTVAVLNGPYFESEVVKHGGGTLLWFTSGKVKSLEIYVNGNYFPENHEELGAFRLYDDA